MFRLAAGSALMTVGFFLMIASLVKLGLVLVGIGVVISLAEPTHV